MFSIWLIFGTPIDIGVENVSGEGKNANIRHVFLEIKNINPSLSIMRRMATIDERTRLNGCRKADGTL